MLTESTWNVVCGTVMMATRFRGVVVDVAASYAWMSKVPEREDEHWAAAEAAKPTVLKTEAQIDFIVLLQ